MDAERSVFRQYTQQMWAYTFSTIEIKYEPRLHVVIAIK